MFDTNTFRQAISDTIRDFLLDDTISDDDKECLILDLCCVVDENTKIAKLVVVGGSIFQ